jgi:ketosteroid isomerase-like protein
MSLGYLEDRLAINDLFVRYTTALDRGDVETLVDCFTPDAALDSPAVGRPAGHAAIRALPNASPAFTRPGRSCAM